MHFQNLLKTSLERQAQLSNGGILLNPTENIPIWGEDQKIRMGWLHGFYNTDKVRQPKEKIETKMQFSGRGRIAYDCRRIYSAWASACGAKDLTMRLLSGLHAHVVLFMSLSKIGDRVLLLPELGGGHMSTASILQRLGLEIVDIPICAETYQIDREKTRKIIEENEFEFIFIDRSEGLIYEDFSEVFSGSRAYKIFDASQYLSNIISGHHTHPFDMGFDLVISTIHKNFPGPQRAIAFTKEKDEFWVKVLAGTSLYVSNMHIDSIYGAGMCLNMPYIKEYSERMLENAILLEAALKNTGLPIICRPNNKSPTHHIWMRPSSRQEAFSAFYKLEKARILTNYRLLPYGLGYGIRMGTSGATRQGLSSCHINDLAKLIAAIIRDGATASLRRQVRHLALAMKKENEKYSIFSN